MTLLTDQERYDLFYYPLLQCLKGFSIYDIFPKTIEGYQQDGYDMKSIHFLKLFQESYYQRYLINRMIESLQEKSIDPCQLAFVREIQQICLLVDTSLDTVHSHIQQQQQEQEQHRNAVDFQRDDPSIPILQKRPISTPSYAAYIFKETSFHRSVINWIFQLIATRELMDIPLYELPENQELVQILSKYDDTATWIQYFPKNIDLFQILLQQYYASERTITTASYSRTKLLYHRPMVSSEHNLLLHQDYFRTILYFHCCQSVVSTMIQSTILQTTAQIFTQSEQQLINNYQEMIQFFLTYSLNDFFETNHANRERTSDASSSSAAAKSLNILSDMGLSINLYIYSIVIKLLLISRSNNIRSATIMNSWKPKKRVQKGQHQKENNFRSTPTQIDFENIQEHVMDLVNHLFTSANAFDYHSGLIVTDPLPASSASLEWLNQYSPEIMADGIKMLLNLGQGSSLLNPNRVRRQLLPTKRLEINAKKLVDTKTVIPPIPPAIGRERADNPSKNQSSIEHPPLPNVANKSSESVEKGIPLEANNQSRVPQNPVNKAYSVIAEREVDAQLYSEAEQFLREKYDFLMKEIDNRRKKTQWQIKRLKSMERSRKRLILLFQSESLQWEKEKEIQEALFPLKDPDYSNPLLLSARVNSAVTGSGGGEEALGDKEDLFETQSIAMSDLTEDESAMSISVTSVIENRALSFSEEKKEGGHSIQSASISRDRKINNTDTEALNQLATIQEVEEEEEIVAPPILPIQEQSLLTDPIIAVLEQEIEKAEEVISTGHGEVKDKQLVIQEQVEIPSIEEKKSDEIVTIKEITLYERIKQEFYQNYSQLTQAIDQESLFEQLANYLPFSFLFLGINTKALNLLPKAQTDRPIIYFSTTTSALPDKRPLPSSVQQLLSSDSSARKYYQRHLMHHPNITKDLFDYLLSQSYIEEKMHSTLSIQFLQNRSCYASMLRSDELLNQRLFQKIFYEDHLLQIISIFQQYFLISSKHQFIIDLTSDLIEEYYHDYLISFYDLLSSAETAGSVGTAPTAFNLTPWLYHPQPMHYFQQRRRKAQFQKEHELDQPDANANFVQFVSPLWTTTNLFNTVDKLLKLNLYPREMNQYRKCVQYDIPSTHPHHSSSSSPMTLLSYQSDMKDPKLWIWKQFLSKDLLSTLQLHFAIPYPLNCFFHASLLQKTSLFTQRYLEVYQLVKSYQLLWSELKQWKQYSSGRRASTSNSDLLQTTPAEERQKFSHHQYYRILHVYYYSLGTTLQAFHQYMNNRVMMANYHLYEAFRGFYISFLSKQVPSPRNGTAASSSDQMSFVIHILEAYGRELAESSFQFEQEKPNEPPEEGKLPTNHHPITTFCDLQHLMENNIHRINTISMIKYYITACLEECRLCLAQFFLIIFTEKAKQQQDKMLVANNLYDTFYDRTEPLKKKNPAVGVENKDKGKEQATGKEKEKVNNGRRNPLSDESMGKAISILKFHLMKITEYQKLIQDYGRKLTSSPSPSLPSSHHYQYKTHIQTLLMYLFPQQ